MPTRTTPSGLDPAIFTKKNETRPIPLNDGATTTIEATKANTVFGWHCHSSVPDYWYLGWYSDSRKYVFFQIAGINKKMKGEWRWDIVSTYQGETCNTLESAIQATEAALVAGAVNDEQ